MSALTAPVRRTFTVVDIRAVLSMVGRIISFLSLAQLAPIIIALIYEIGRAHV